MGLLLAWTEGGHFDFLFAGKPQQKERANEMTTYFQLGPDVLRFFTIENQLYFKIRKGYHERFFNLLYDHADSCHPVRPDQPVPAHETELCFDSYEEQAFRASLKQAENGRLKGISPRSFWTGGIVCKSKARMLNSSA